MFRKNETQRNNQNSQNIKRSSDSDAGPSHKSVKTFHEFQTQENTVRSMSLNKREREFDENVLSRRQKQIDFGKNTLAYDRYRSSVPKDKRTKDDPKTPPKHLQMNRRAFDGLIKNWKIKLHKWNEENSNDR